MEKRTARTGIIAVLDLPWSDRWQGEANLLSRLAERYEVIWMESAHPWRMMGKRWRSGVPTFRRPAEAPELEVYSAPTWLPVTYRPAVAGRLLHGARLRAVRRRLLSRGCDRIVLYAWRPRHVDVLNLVEHDASIYHIVDEYSFSETDLPTSAREQRLLRDVDQVIVHSPALLEKKGTTNPHTSLIPNGVDYSWFAEPCPEPEDLADIKRPRIGYCGYVKRQLDWNLIEALVNRHQEWSWVFVGKESPHPELGPILAALSTRPNVHFLGAKSSRELARYPQHFDACIMPYKVDGYTRYIFPLKLPEYLASGRPAVGPPIRTLRDFAHVITLADGVEEWSRAIEKALEPDENTPSARLARQAVAREYDWASLADRVAELIERTLERVSGDQMRRAD